ncbi:neuraminidase-like domain-containing protein [Sorangium sp. So ce260]|uniref:Tc toxin subunit A-related protein n=1 Tax=Sorangium sp. So ce260 TaxID=3133291 RepID=UPI003F5D7D29
MSTYQLSGRIVRAKTELGVSEVRVEAWDSAEATTDLIAVAVTNENGDFEMALEQAVLDRFFQGRLPVLTLRAFTSGGAELVMHHTQWSVSHEPVTLRIEVDPAVTSTERAPTPSVVRGTVRTLDGDPASNMVVRAYDVNLSSVDLIGSGQTNFLGHYKIEYTSLDRAGKHQPNLELRIFNSQEQQVGGTGVFFRAPSTAVIDLTASPLGGSSDPSELTKIRLRTEVHTQGVDLAEIDDNDVEFLAKATGVGRVEIEALKGAEALLSVGVSESSEFYYPFARKGLPTTKRKLLAYPRAVLRRALVEAFDEHLIPGHSSHADSRIDLLIEEAVRMALDDPPPAGQTGNLGQLLAKALPTQSLRSELLTAFLEHEGPPEALWAELATRPSFQGAGVIPSTQLALQIGTLTRYHFPLIDELWARKQGGQITAFKDLAAYSEADWIAILALVRNGSPINFPADTPGGTVAEKRAAYAKVLRRAMEVAFPTKAVASSIAAAGASGMTTFFNNNPSFELGKTRVGDYLASHPNALSGISNPTAAALELKAVERLHRLTPKYEEAKVLLDAGLTSARAIARTGRARFLAEHGASLGGDAIAADIHDKARAAADQATALALKFSAAYNPRSAFALPDQESRASESPAAFATYANLFGSPDACACAHCASVYGPAAYLADVLHFLDRYDSKVTKSGSARWTAKELLLGSAPGSTPSLPGRRPDIGHIDLTCENADTPLPYVDLVNEILVHAIASEGQTPLAFPEHIATVGTAEQLAAMPNPPSGEEAWHSTAYGRLLTSYFPFALPYDRRRHEIYLYLEHLGVPLHTFMASMDLSLVSPQLGDFTARAVERLGLSPLEHAVIVGNLGGLTTAAAWGLATNATLPGPLLQVPELLARTGLSHDALLDLIESSVLARFGSPAIQPAGSCKIEEQSVTGLTNVSGALATMHRFIRLQQRLGWSIRELDQVLAACAPSGTNLVNDRALRVIATIQALRTERGISLPISVLASWFGPLDTQRRDGGKTPSFYEQLFQNKAVTNPVDAALALSSVASLSSSDLIVSHTRAVLAALRMSREELDLLTVYSGLNIPVLVNVSTVIPALSAIAALHRIVTFARAARLSVRDFLELYNLSSDKPFSVDNPERTLRFLETVERVRRSGLSPADLEVVFRGRPSSRSRIAVTDEAIKPVLDQLFGSLLALRAKNGAPDSTAEAALIEDQLGAALKLDARSTHLLVTDILTTGDPDPAPLGGAFSLPVSPPPSLEEDLGLLAAQLAAYRHLAKAAALVQRLGLSADEIARMFVVDAGAGPGAAPVLDLDALPREPTQATGSALFAAWERLVDLVALRPHLVGSSPSLASLFVSDPAALAAITGWPEAEIIDLGSFYGLLLAPGNPALHAGELLSARHVMAATRRFGISVGTASSWVTNLSSDPARLASDVLLAAKAKYSEAEWARVAPPLRDVLRERLRAVMVAYLVAKRGHEDSDELFAELLVDVETSPAVITSRLKQAIGSVQTFVQRALMNLEAEELTLPEEAAREWSWRKSYRVWEASRKVLLQTELYLDPSLRDDKSPFFKALEDELRQKDITDDAAERAFARYLDRLDQVANLEIMAACHQKEDGDDTHLPIDVLHVVGRTAVKPYKYFYRTRVDGLMWTAWEPIDLDIEAENLLIVVEDRRPNLFWPILEERPDPYQTIPSDTSQPGKTASSRWYIRLAWSERRNDAWGERRMSAGREVSGPNGLPPEYNSLMIERYSDAPLEIAVMWAPGFAYRFGHFTRSGCGVLEGTDEAVTMQSYEHVHHFNPAVPRDTVLRRQHAISNDWATELAVPIRVDGFSRQITLLRNVEPFRVLIPREIFANKGASAVGPRDSAALGASFFFYKDARSTFLAELVVSTYIKLEQQDRARPRSTAFADVGERDEALTLRAGADLVDWATTSEGPHVVLTTEEAKLYRFTSFYHPYVCLFRKELQRAGVDGLLKWSLHRPKPLQLSSREFFVETYDPDFSNVHESYPREEVDFSVQGAYSLYNWELFFHAPFLIALRLMQSGRHAEAQRWFHFIFDPTTGDPDPAPGRFWNVRPFRENKDLASIEDELRELPASEQGPMATLLGGILTDQSGGEERDDLAAQIEAWRKDPFNPHIVARMRPIAYQKAVLMKYVDNLIAWGDQLFRRETIESINEATQLYVLAGNLLGRRPRRSERKDATTPRNYWQLEAAGLGDLSDPVVQSRSRVELESIKFKRLQKLPSRPLEAPVPDLGELYFCVPRDEALAPLWDTVADRLFKIRHSMNIEGVVRTLPLFEPPIDPMLLVQARALGVDLATVLNEASSPRLPYRFQVLHAKATEFCSAVAGLGAALLAAMEKKDGEAIARLRSGHELELLAAVREIRAQQVKEAQANLAALERSHELAKLRRDHYAGLPRISAAEQGALAMSVVGMELGLVAQAIAAIAPAVEAIPPITFGGAGAFGSPVATTTIGGQASGAPIEAASQALSMVAGALREGASIASTLAGYERRAEEWALQERLAAKEMQGLEKQIVGAKIRVAVAEVELRNHERQTEQAREVLAFLTERKRTTEELYDWMVAELSTVHYQAYTLAYDMAKRAERALRFELGAADGTLAMVRFGAWDSLKQGLLAGERLQLDLRRLEVAFLEQTPREAELVKHVSLAEVAPEQLMQLRETGTCDVELKEELFDLDYPGHYLRRIKSVAITIPTVTGPYAGVSCTLTLSNTSVRSRAQVSESYAHPTNFRTDLVPVTNVIATSGGASDAGLFEPNLRDERYLPFEGAGVIGTYKIELPAANNRFDIGAVSDVILHIRYTARSDGNLAGVAKTHYSASANAPKRRRLFSLRSELPAEWARFMAVPSDDSVPQQLSIPLTPEMFPYSPATKKIALTSYTLYARWNGKKHYSAGGELQVSVARPGAVLDTPTLVKYPDSNDRNMGASVKVSLLESIRDLDTWTLSASRIAVGQIHGELKTGNNRLNDTLQDIYLLCEYDYVDAIGVG